MRFIKLFYLLAAVLYCTQQTLNAQSINELQGRNITDIKISGLSITDSNFVFSVINSQPGSKLILRNVANDINSIYRLGFADDISIDAQLDGDGVALEIIIAEKPRVQNIKFQGNNRFEAKTLLEKMKIKQHSILNSESLARDVRTIRDHYRQKKFNDVKVIYEVVPVSKGKVDLIFKIIESPQTYITEININGANYFYPLYLKRLMLSRKIDCFSWATSSGVLDEARINNDLRIIYQTYQDAGFIKVKINKPRIRIFQYQTYSKAVVDLTIEEGARYKVSGLSVSATRNESLLVDSQQLINDMKLKIGEYYSQSSFFQDRTNLDYFYQDRGYAFSKVVVNTDVDDQNKTIAINYVIDKKDKVYINRVNIQGNQSTRDYVIRRELTLHDSQLYRISKVQESQSNLGQLGYFDQQTGINFVKKENLDRTIDYDLNVKEALTGTFNLALTYSENSGLGISSQIAKRNFLGRGNSISAKVNSDGNAAHDISLSLTEPYLLGTKLSSTSSVSYSKSSNKTSTGKINYRTESYAFSEIIGQPIWANWTLFYRLTWRKQNYTDISENGLELLNFVTSHDEKTLNLTLSYDTVNHPIFSSRGLKLTLGYSLVGVLPGSNVRYDSLRAEGQYFKSLSESDALVFMARYRFHRLFQQSEDKPIPPQSRIAIGGITTLRGFSYASVRGANTSTEVDANFNLSDLKTSNYDLYRYYKLHEDGIMLSLINLELLFPLGTDKSNIRGVVFYDAGNVWSEEKMYEITGAKLNYSYYKMSYGAGVRIITPAGVLRFEYAEIINPKPGDNSGKLEFYIGALF